MYLLFIILSQLFRLFLTSGIGRANMQKEYRGAIAHE